MDWLAMTPAVVVAIVLLIAPGAGLGAAFGLRGASAFITAAPLSASLIGFGSIVARVLRLPWSPLVFAGASGLAILASLLAWILAGRPTMRIVRFSSANFITGMAITSALMVAAMITLFPHPDLLAQTFDNVFHLNAIRYALDSGDASSLSILSLTSGGQVPSFYPAAWHAFIALVVQAVQVTNPAFTIPMGVNAGTLALVLSAWSVGCLAVTQIVAGSSLVTAALAAATFGSTYLFPWLFVRWGSLYPNLFGNSLLPPLLAVLLLLARPAAAEYRPRRGIAAADRSAARSGDRAPGARSKTGMAQLSGKHARGLGVIVLVAAAPGVGLAHPNSAFALVLAALVSLWFGWGRRLLPIARRPVVKAVALTALIAASAAVATAWIVLAPAQPQAPPAPSDWQSVLTNLLLGAANERIPAAATLTVLMALGLVTAVRLRAFLPAAWAVVATAVYTVATAGPTSDIALAAGGLFYSDTLRILVFVFVLSVPLLSMGVAALADAIEWLASRVRHKRILETGLTFLVAAAIAVPMQIWSLQPGLRQASAKYVVPSENAQYLSEDELTLMLMLGSIVPHGDRVVADPGNGGGFIYALSGVPLVFPHMFVTDTAASAQIRNSMFDPKQLEGTCSALAALNAWYFYDTKRWHSRYFSGPKYFPGLAKPKASMLTPVASVGEATLYRFSACDR